MATYRVVSPGFWNDTKVVDMFTPEDRYFMLYLLTNPHTTLLGCYEISIKQISAETGYTRDTIYNLIARFTEQYKILDYSEKDKEILIKNWSKYNWSRSPKTKTAIEKSIGYVKCERFRAYLAETMQKKFNLEPITSNREQVTGNREQVTDVCIGYAYPIDRVSDIQNAQDTPSQMYGEYKNVALTILELAELQKAYPQDWEQKINRLSSYIKQSGKRYDNHYAVIMAWAKEDEAKKTTTESSFNTDEFYKAALNKAYEG